MLVKAKCLTSGLADRAPLAAIYERDLVHFAEMERFTVSDTLSFLQADLKWLRAHVVLVLLTALLITGAVYGVDSLIERHDAANSQKWEQVLAAQEKQTQSLTTLFQEQIKADYAANQELVTSNAKLEQAISERDVALQRQKQQDATLDAQGAASRIVQQTKAQPSDAQAAGDTVVMSLPLSRTIASDLDELQSAIDDAADTKKQLANETQLAANAQSDFTTAQKLIASKDADIADAAKSCDARVAFVKAKARKSFLKGLYTGVVIGFIGKRLILGKW